MGIGRLRSERNLALAPRGRTRMDTKVSTLVNPVSFIPNLAQTRDRRPLRNRGTAVGLLYRLFREIFAVHRQRTATQAVSSAQARHARVAQRFGLDIVHVTYGFNLLMNLSCRAG